MACPMEDFLESLSLPFLAIMIVVGTIILVRLDTLSRRRDLEVSEDEKKRRDPARPPRLD